MYILLNKPEGYITSTKDELGRSTVMKLIKDIKYRVYPVGRLDYDSCGLLLLTNDGQIANKIMHPKYEIGKTYIVNISGVPDKFELDKLCKGIKIEDYRTSPAQIEVLKIKGNTTTIKITIHEGRNRQIKKMFEMIGYKVIKLKRVAIGNIKLGNLKEGHWRYLKNHEVEYLKRF